MKCKFRFCNTASGVRVVHTHSQGFGRRGRENDPHAYRICPPPSSTNDPHAHIYRCLDRRCRSPGCARSRLHCSGLCAMYLLIRSKSFLFLMIWSWNFESHQNSGCPFSLAQVVTAALNVRTTTESDPFEGEML